MNRGALALGVVLLFAGCARDRHKASVMQFKSAEAAVEYVRKETFSEPTVNLEIVDGFTFAGKRDVMGAGMALVVDALLAKGFLPDGFEQKDGYRLYRYKRYR